MSKIDNIDLSNAELALATANTPLFLLRKIKSDSATSYISRTFDGKIILAALKKVLARKPKTVRDAVLPYVLLVALFLSRDLDNLRRASTLKASQAIWFKFIADILVSSVQVDSYHDAVVMPRQHDSISTSASSSLSTHRVM